jgi:hypothetical protein
LIDKYVYKNKEEKNKQNPGEEKKADEEEEEGKIEARLTR